MAKIDGMPSLFPILPAAEKAVGIAKMAAQAEVVDHGHQVEFRALPARSILNYTNSRRGFGFARSINPYRGCEFGCQYCYARYTHEFMELREPRAFERQIYIKENAAWLLRQDLRTLRPGEAIAIGTATDPYQPIERDAQVTRSLLEVLADQRGLHLGLVTKSTLVARDIDLFQRIALYNRITISLTITTLDTHLARILEPRAPRPDLRIRTLGQLCRAGLRAGVSCSPLLPGLTDTHPAVDHVAAAAKKAGAHFFFAEPLFLKPCSKSIFEEFIARNFPELLDSYRERFQDRAFVGNAYRKRVRQIVNSIKEKYGWNRKPSEPVVQMDQSATGIQMKFLYPSPQFPKRTNPPDQQPIASGHSA